MVICWVLVWARIDYVGNRRICSEGTPCHAYLVSLVGLHASPLDWPYDVGFQVIQHTLFHVVLANDLSPWKRCPYIQARGGVLACLRLLAATSHVPLCISLSTPMPKESLQADPR